MSEEMTVPIPNPNQVSEIFVHSGLFNSDVHVVWSERKKSLSAQEIVDQS